MDKELKTKWVAALRSGEYEQGVAYLENSGAYCCLGVLCKVADIPVEDASEFMDSNAANKDMSVNDEAYAAVSNIVNGELGPTDEDRLPTAELMSLNDDQDYDFFRIADYIEEHL